jgi:general stress protein 26
LSCLLRYDKKKRKVEVDMNPKIITEAENIVANLAGKMSEGFCALALIDENGYPSASTVSISKADGIKWITFCVGIGDNKAKRIRQCNRASVCINSSDYNITLVGTAEILTDPKIKEEMWYAGCEEIWSGADDPDYCVLRFVTERYSLFVECEQVVGTF